MNWNKKENEKMERLKSVMAQGAIKEVAATKKVPAKSEETSLKSWVMKYTKNIEAALPSVMTAERFQRICLSALSANPLLSQCTPESFLGAMMNAAQLGLEPNSPLGQAYLIPYYSKKKNAYECQFQLGYRGMISLVYRSGEVATMDAQAVHENDEFIYELGLEPKLLHKPFMGDRGRTVAYYAIWKGKDGGYGFNVMSKEEIMQHALQYSKQKSGGALSGVWASNFDAMAKKTVLKAALKYAPISTEVSRFIGQDETVKRWEATDGFNIQDAPNAIEVDYTVDEETGEVLSE